ncbi:MAG TPA: glycerol-3-phosphate 1-O-acyltransferase [Mariprofundaceae bacterium]|nr:glycerol-3-phosphate 1-O-acyltransferase [Mariprofundaceae bacterium]
MSEIVIIVSTATYFIGAIPFGLLFARWLTGKDPREHGSGNTGATNALRTGGKKVGILTLIADVFKGVIPVSIAITLDFNESQVLIVALAAFLGHIFPIYLKFKGGKGVATMFGVLLPWEPMTAVISFAVWLITFKLTRYVSLASILAGFSLPLVAWLWGASDAAIVGCLIVGGLMTVRHHENVSRLIAGTESKV